MELGQSYWNIQNKISTCNITFLLLINHLLSVAWRRRRGLYKFCTVGNAIETYSDLSKIPKDLRDCLESVMLVFWLCVFTIHCKYSICHLLIDVHLYKFFTCLDINIIRLKQKRIHVSLHMGDLLWQLWREPSNIRNYYNTMQQVDLPKGCP